MRKTLTLGEPKMRIPTPFSITSSILLTTGLASAQWAQLADETDSRLVLDPAFEYLNLEKDVDWGDFDKDGDVDIVVAMKFVGSVEGGWPNLLLMNENGVLVDRTAEYGTASDIPGDTGFMENTNDRDIRPIDFDGDGWIDLITTTTMSDGIDWTLGQPRAYRNLGNDASGNWLGFIHERDRIPRIYAMSGAGSNGRYCDVAVGDFNGDGYPDLFFTDYDTPETAGGDVCIYLNGDGDTNDPRECQDSPFESSNDDHDSKLIMNWGDDGPGPGYFYDSLNTIMTASELSTDFGNTAEAADMNGDGKIDVVHVNTLGVNIVEVLWNEGPEPGDDFGLETIYTGAPYFHSAGDLDGDADLDLVIVDDSQDRYAINTGNGSDGRANFTTYVIGDSLSEFGNTSKLFDLDNDGDLDVFIADVDADLPSFCPSTGRRAHMYENTGDIDELFVEDSYPIPTNQLAASFDVAPVDINGDGWIDLFHCKCSGFIVWMNQPPIRVDFSYPSGAPPATTDPGSATTFQIDLTPVGGTVDSGTAKLSTRLDGGSFVTTDLVYIGGTTWEATLPAMDCGSQVEFYVSADISGNRFTDPPSAPGSLYTAQPISGTEVTLQTFESSDGGFTASADASTTAGYWEIADPNGTISSGLQIAPDEDATSDGTLCWVTQNGSPGGSAGTADIDGGPVTLTSGIIDLTDSDAVISMAVWMKCDDAVLNPADADSMTIQVSNNGIDWTTVVTVTADIDNDGDIDASDAAWSTRSFVVSEHVAPTGAVQVRFQVSDNPNNSVTEAGVDDFSIEVLICEDDGCVGDIDGNGTVGGADLATLLGYWGTSDPAIDLNGDGLVDGADLAIILGVWGDC